ncbi:hypothetical protein [Metabacillus sediminilitoris]|uniref:Uncharacterized protein n=1 Tax=Metabacillus sediminilitoris TaxID=2567941 RepID=A0A4S4BV12_9BACI|nr:hypothetical protein [Metabacillus sediminilitoris]QGQ44703.1 hypothetical protein GMB29_05120 [Metabacillus sediminilitoris]THF78949.1 hypothetical protein E6W99_14610 [Metabacillus sediminilitoris]
MHKKQGLQIVNRSVSKQHEKNLYIGHKTSDNYTVHGGGYKRRKFGNGGCGCGSNPKQVRR